MVVLAATCVVSNVNGDDPSFFVVVAPVTNLLWLAGSVWLAFALRRAGRVPKAVWIALPFMQILALPLSAVGGMAVAGAYWLAVGYLLMAGAPLRDAPAPATA